MMDFLKVFRPLIADFFSTIIFIVALEITDNVVLSTAVGIAAGVLQIGWMRFRNQKIEPMQWASFALVVVLGSATILTKDARFMMIKPSIAGAAIACVMLRRGWQNRYFPARVKENVSEGFLIGWGYVWAALYFAMAVANLVVALEFGRHVWESFTALVPTIAPLTLFFVQYATIRATVIRNIRARSIATANAAPAE
jgi:intracellular septation protein